MSKAYIVLGLGDTPKYLDIFKERALAAIHNANNEDLLIFCGTNAEKDLARKLAGLHSIRNIETLSQKNTFEEIKAALKIAKHYSLEEVIVSTEFPHVFVAKYIAMLMNGDAGHIAPFTSKSAAYWIREARSFLFTAMRFMGFSPETTILYKATTVLNRVEK